MKVLPKRGWGELASELAQALTEVEARGVTWKGTRFDKYLRFAQELGEMGPARVAERRGERITDETISQGLQLAAATRLFRNVPPHLLVPKLKGIVSGAEVHDGIGNDHPRNTLFELTVAELLHDYGFSVQLTTAAEDIVASHPRLPDRFSVECKRPMHCTTPEQREKRVRENLVALRAQLLKRDRTHIRMGVLGMDGVYGASGQIVRAADAGAISAMVDSALRTAITEIRAMAKARNLRLESSMRVGALAFIGVGMDDAGTAYSVRCLRCFTLDGDRHFARALRAVIVEGGGSG